MDTRYLLIGTAALALANAAAAEPAKGIDARDSAGPKVAEVVLASASQMRAPTVTPEQASAAPAKRQRAARVTTCRCAGQLPAAEQSDQ